MSSALQGLRFPHPTRLANGTLLVLADQTASLSVLATGHCFCNPLTIIKRRDSEGRVMSYRNQGEDRGESGRGGYQPQQGRPRHEGEETERARGEERGSYAGRSGFQGDQDVESSGRGAGDWREDSRGGWDDGRVSMEPRGDGRSGSENDRSSYGSRGEWRNTRGESTRGSDSTNWRGGEGSSMGDYGRTTGYGRQGTSYGGMGAGPYEGSSGGPSRGDSRSYGGQGTRGGFGGDSGRQYESDSQRGSRGSSGSESGNGGSWADGRRWASENAAHGGSGLGFGGEGLGNQSWGPQSFGTNSGWASRGFEGMGGTSGGNDSESDRGRHAGKGPKNYRRNDERIKEDVSERLKDHDDIDASDIDIEVSSGMVTLSGEVKSRREKRLAEDAIEGVSGVEDITNQLRVRSQNGREDAERDNPNARTSSSGSGTQSSSKSSTTGVGPLSSSMSAASGIEKHSQSKGRTIGSTNES